MSRSTPAAPLSERNCYQPWSARRSVRAVARREHRPKLFQFRDQFCLLFLQDLSLKVFLAQFPTKCGCFAQYDYFGRTLFVSRRRYLLLELVEEVFETDAAQAFHVVVYRTTLDLRRLTLGVCVCVGAAPTAAGASRTTASLRRARRYTSRRYETLPSDWAWRTRRHGWRYCALDVLTLLSWRWAREWICTHVRARQRRLLRCSERNYVDLLLCNNWEHIQYWCILKKMHSDLGLTKPAFAAIPNISFTAFITFASP